MFHMEHCVFAAFLSKGSSFLDCGRPCEKHRVHLRDRVGIEHPLARGCGLPQHALQCHAADRGGALAELRAAGAGAVPHRAAGGISAETRRVLAAYRELLEGRATGAELWRELKAQSQLGVTSGTCRMPAVIFETLAPLVLIIALGTVLAKIKFLGHDFMNDLNKLAFWVALPALLFTSASHAIEPGGQLIRLMGCSGRRRFSSSSSRGCWRRIGHPAHLSRDVFAIRLPRKLRLHRTAGAGLQCRDANLSRLESHDGDGSDRDDPAHGLIQTFSP